MTVRGPSWSGPARRVFSLTKMGVDSGSDGPRDHRLVGYVAPVDRGVDQPFGEPIERAVFEQVNRIPGAVAYTFDYHDDSLKWVDAPEVGGRLAQAIDCLYEWARRPIIVVAHSMGGLATKWVAATVGPYGSRADEIGLVVTLGTPFEGSDLLAGIHDVLNGGAVAGAIYGNPLLPVLRLLFLACGASADVDADACGIFGVPDSDAGDALAAGSNQLAALGVWSDIPEVVSLGGSIIIHDLAGLGIFYSDAGWDSVDVGDIAVPTHSGHRRIGSISYLDL